MKISYSGIQIEVCHLIDFKRTPVMSDDGVDYLFTKFEVICTGLISSDQVLEAIGVVDRPLGISYKQEGFGELSVPGRPPGIGRPPSILKTAASNPIITDKAIRHWLEIPRRRLIIEHDNPAPPQGQILLQSPKSGYVCDAHNGPVPTVYDVHESVGDARVFLVSFGIETYVNECEENVGLLGAFLSNRFSQTQDIDADGFITIVTEGEARFRTDLIYGQLNPDLLRPFLFLPIPNGFKRGPIRVSGLSDVSGMRYEFVDQQMPQQLVVGDEIGATRVEASYRQIMMTNEDALGTALNTIDRHYSIAVNSKWAKPDEEKSKDDPKPKKKRKKKKKDMD